MSVVIKAEGLSKKYIIGHEAAAPYSTLRDAVANRARIFGSKLLQPFTSKSPDGHYNKEEFWALNDVSFEIQEGKRVGIIGRNGAGKSTLLKILSRITETTRGRVAIRGRVASLLEVGTGFHPELTGRENIFLNGAVLGMSKHEIKRKFEEIVSFAEVEKFLDTPVKRYSSGMYVRLAFSVAAHLDPEILIVDEVLAVGDYQFQKKCLGKMGEVGKDGRTLLFVSHNMSAVASLCTDAIWLDQGRIVGFGSTRRVIGDYLDRRAIDTLVWAPANGGNPAFEYHKVEVVSESEPSGGDGFAPDVPIHIVFDYTVKKMLPPGRLAVAITNQEGTVVLASASTDASPALNKVWHIGKTTSRCTIPAYLLAPGRYYVTVSEPTENGDAIHEGIVNFRVGELTSLASRDGRSGVIAPLLIWCEERASK